MNHIIFDQNLFTAFLSLPGGTEMIVLLALGLLIFGRRLPEIGRSVGRSIVEFKRGIRGIEDDMDEASSRPEDSPRLADQAVSAPTISPPAESTPSAAQPIESEKT